MYLTTQLHVVSKLRYAELHLYRPVCIYPEVIKRRDNFTFEIVKEGLDFKVSCDNTIRPTVAVAATAVTLIQIITC